MFPMRTSMSSPSAAIEQLVRRLWYGCRARITQVFSAYDLPVVPTTPLSTASKLPLEIVQIIISHLIYDTRSLLACSLTCYSWYIASVPHLHRTLIVPFGDWPKPLRNATKFRLLPLVKKFCIHGSSYVRRPFPPKRFNHRILRQISGMTNIRELHIDDLDIPRFIPRARHYLGHFLPRLQSLCLGSPEGSCRQIIFFIGLFEHLQDLTLLRGTFGNPEHEPADDPTLIPPFSPPLQGRLMMVYFMRVGFLENMIDLLGGVRFRHMDLFGVGETQLVLYACAKTLETLRLYPANPWATPSIRRLDLSRNKSLRAVEVVARTVVPMGGKPNSAVSTFLRTTLSTITSHEFSEVVVFYRDYDFVGIESCPHRGPNMYRKITPALGAMEASWHRWLFKVFREMYAARHFQLVLCAEVWDPLKEYTMGVLRRAVAVQKAAKRLSYLPSEPLVVSSPRRYPEEGLGMEIPYRFAD